MSEFTSQSVEQTPTFSSIEHVFEHILGIPFPEKPEDLPNEMTLGPEIYGGLLKAILAQKFEDPHTSPNGKPRERSQIVGILKRDGTVENTDVSEKFSRRSLGVVHELKRFFGPVLWKDVKPLVFWHTHTLAADTPTVTESDVSELLGEDRKCVIYLQASPTEITAIFQTRAAYPKRIPFSTMNKGFGIYDELSKFYDSSSPVRDLTGLALFLEKHGYVLYMWKKPEGITDVIQAIDRGIFLEGIKLNRIGLPLYMRNLLKNQEETKK